MPLSAATITSVEAALAQLGVPLPAKAQAASDTLAALDAEASRDVVTEALQAAAGSPLTPKNAAKRVQDLAAALTARDRAAEAARHYERPVLEQFRQGIAENIDGLIVAMRPYFDHAAEAFHTAGTTVEPGTTPSVSLNGLGAVQAHMALDQAQQMLTNVTTARLRITEMAGYAEPNVTWFLESAADIEALDRARALWRRSAHHLTAAGYRLRLNTIAEAADVARNAAATSAAVDRAKQQARAAANRDPLRDAAYAKLGL